MVANEFSKKKITKDYIQFNHICEIQDGRLSGVGALCSELSELTFRL